MGILKATVTFCDENSICGLSNIQPICKPPTPTYLPLVLQQNSGLASWQSGAGVAIVCRFEKLEEPALGTWNLDLERYIIIKTSRLVLFLILYIVNCMQIAYMYCYIIILQPSPIHLVLLSYGFLLVDK